MNKSVKQKSGALNHKIVLLRVLLVLSVTVVMLCLTVFLSLKALCSDRYPNVQSTFVTTILETGQMKSLVSIFMKSEKIQEIVDANSMKALDSDVDEGLISLAGVGESSKEDMAEPGEDIEIFEVAGATYTGTMMIVKDPSRVSLATIYPWREMGVTLDELVTQNDAVAGINGGLYKSDNNSGGRPLGVIVSNGEIQYNRPNDCRGLVLVGFTTENILQIIDINGMSEAQVTELVETRHIRDAVTFQEEASDANNHFVQLIINNEARQMNGAGSGLNPRTAIGQRADGAVLMFVTDGRGKSGHLGASSGDLIAVMQEYGAVNAANLDGGSSSCMYYDGEYLMESVTFYYANSSWRLPAGFIVR